MAISTSVAGAVMIVFGAGVTVRSGLLLTGRGRPRRGPRPPFVIAGPYRRIRNPLYAGLIVAGFGMALVAGSRAIAIVALLGACAAHAWVVALEEPRLRARFGDAYATYLACVPRWFPRRPLVD